MDTVDLSYSATFQPIACDGCSRKFDESEQVFVVAVQPDGADFEVNCATCKACADDFNAVGPRALVSAAQRSQSFAKWVAQASD